ncbi:MAG: NTF2 fold immunity protein [Anaerolineales bacterium]
MRLLTSTLLALLFVPRLAHAQDLSHRYIPPRGFVPDSATAVRVAVAVWTPIFGEREIMSEAPFVATLTDSVWTVTGTLHSDHPGRILVLGGTVVEGGRPLAKIAQFDGRILSVTYGL